MGLQKKIWYTNFSNSSTYVNIKMNFLQVFKDKSEKVDLRPDMVEQARLIPLHIQGVN